MLRLFLQWSPYFPLFAPIVPAHHHGFAVYSSLDIPFLPFDYQETIGSAAVVGSIAAAGSRRIVARIETVGPTTAAGWNTD